MQDQESIGYLLSELLRADWQVTITRRGLIHVITLQGWGGTYVATHENLATVLRLAAAGETVRS